MKSKINVPTISLPEAIDRVKLFRSQFSKQASEGTVIPRAILIPIADILAIIKNYEQINDKGELANTLLGVRAYFAIKEMDMDLPDDVTALIVPVDLEGNDLIETRVGGLGDPGDDDGTGIYDFTKPCPTECDTKSPLYVEIP